jgi:hypothetical protein
MQDGTISFQSPYNAGLVAALKKAIPYSDRRWDRDQKLWFVAPRWAETLANLAERFALLECGHKVPFGSYPIESWPERLYCPMCKAIMMTDAHRQDIEEDDPWDVADYENDYMDRYPIDSDDLPC